MVVVVEALCIKNQPVSRIKIDCNKKKSLCNQWLVSFVKEWIHIKSVALISADDRLDIQEGGTNKPC